MNLILLFSLPGRATNGTHFSAYKYKIQIRQIDKTNSFTCGSMLKSSNDFSKKPRNYTTTTTIISEDETTVTSIRLPAI